MANDTGDLLALARRSVEVIAEFQDVGGAYVASPTFSVYQFSWFRDGAFIADAMSRVGAADSAERFFGWCAKVLAARRHQINDLVARKGGPIHRDEFLPTRYTLAGGDTGEHWWDFQTDGYGTWMWALWQHTLRHGTSAEPYRDAVELCTRYVSAFWNLPCFDWWEEFPDCVHTSTLSSLHAGLSAAVAMGVLEPQTAATAGQGCIDIERRLLANSIVDGRLRKAESRPDIDASLIACFTPFATFEPTSPLARNTYARILTDLAPDGVHRYLDDTYFGGGRWVVLAGLVGWHEAATGHAERAMGRLRWMHAQATPDGLLPEQVHMHALHPERVDEWINKWGPVATPLLWSHAMYLTLGEALGLWDVTLAASEESS